MSEASSLVSGVWQASLGRLGCQPTSLWTWKPKGALVSWFKIDDQFYDHPKVVALGEDHGQAIALWTLAGSWSSRQLTDGAVASGMVRRLGFGAEAAAALVRVGLWEATPDGYQFHDWLEYNPSSAAEKAKRAANKERQTRYRGVTKGVTPDVSNATVTRPVTPAVTRDKRDCHTPPVPVPVPVPVPLSDESVARTPGHGMSAALDQVNAAREASGLDPMLMPSANDRTALHALAVWCSAIGGMSSVGKAFAAYIERATDWERAHDFPLQAFARNPGQYLRPPPAIATPGQRGPVPVSSAEDFALDAANNPDWAKEVGHGQA
jgi:hypothetical protein